MTKTELRELKELREHLTLHKFGGRDAIVSKTFIGGDDGKTVEEFTRIWRETWLLPPLDRIIRKHDPTWSPVNAHYGEQYLRNLDRR